jgi:hypothetical protein
MFTEHNEEEEEEEEKNRRRSKGHCQYNLRL